MNFTITILLATAMAMETGENAFARPAAPAARQVTVYYSDAMEVKTRVALPAFALASKMFSGIGIHLNWRLGSPVRPEPGSVVVEFATGVPATFKPDALAYALPYEGVHIRIFADRIATYPNPSEVLAHVLVHEITHILQGEARHSAEGIMKAKWTQADYNAMAARPLSFTAEDVDLINRGLDRRATRILAGTKPSTDQTTIAVTAEAGAR